MTISATHYGEPYDVYSRQRTRWKSNSSPPLRRHYRMYGIKCKRSSTSDLEYLWKLKVHIQKRPKEDLKIFLRLLPMLSWSWWRGLGFLLCLLLLFLIAGFLLPAEYFFHDKSQWQVSIKHGAPSYSLACSSQSLTNRGRRGDGHDALPVFSRCAGFSYYSNQY